MRGDVGCGNCSGKERHLKISKKTYRGARNPMNSDRTFCLRVLCLFIKITRISGDYLSAKCPRCTWKGHEDISLALARTIEDDGRSRAYTHVRSKSLRVKNNFLVSICHEYGNGGEGRKRNEYESRRNGKKGV